MANICYFIDASLTFYVFKYGRDVVFAHLRPAELPVTHMDARVVVQVLPAVSVASEIAKPHIIALVDCQEGR